ncbi:tyrosine recombinase XerC [Treponema sp.]
MDGKSVKVLAYRLVEADMTARRLAEGTKRLTRLALRDFFRWASRRGTPDVRALGKKDLVAFHAWLGTQSSKRSAETLAASTRNGRFRAVRLLYSCLYRSGAIGENPAHGLVLKAAEPRSWRRRPLSREEITTFLETIDVESATGFRDRALFELLYSSGLRVGEAAKLKVKDINFAARQMIVRGKFDRDRMVPISEVACAFLVAWLGPRIGDADAWVFPGYGGHLTRSYISDRFRELLRRFAMDRKELSAHSIRHSTATHLLENGASVRHVQELLGHANIESTARYTHVMADGLAKVYRKHHPREHELYEAVDEEYERKLAAVIAGTPKSR